jgi:DNA-binding CsgD family transcriptional regulator
MLAANIENIVYYLQSQKVNPAVPTRDILKSLDEAEGFGKTGFMIFDFENNNLFFANNSAMNLLGADKFSMGRCEASFLESVLHPSSYQHIMMDIRAFQQRPDQVFSNVYCVKSEGKGKFAWIYASSKVISFTSLGAPKLIYICFVEIERALHYYVKILNNSAIEDGIEAPILLVDSLKTREIEILGLICAECTSKEIAMKLNITQAAVDAARKRLIQKLGVKSVAGLVKVALSLGLNRPEGYGNTINRSFISKEVRAYPFRINKRFGKKTANA